MPEQEKPFHELLSEHMAAGTSPGPITHPWKQNLLAAAIGKTERALRYYLDGGRVPDTEADYAPIETAFFGTATNSEAALTLRRAWQTAREARGQPGRKPRGDSTAPPAPTITRPDRCLGRDSDLVPLLAALRAEGGTTALILGEGGVGKTTLTREAATHPDIADRFGPRRHEIALATATSAGAMLDAIATALGTDPKQGLAGIRARLAAPALLLLDNLETPWEAEPEAVESLLRELAATPGLALLASIRGTEAPRTRWQHRQDLSPLSPDAARALFVAIAFRIPPNDPDLATLLPELGGLPLAIELVARQAEPDTTARRVLAEWRRQGPALPDARANPEHRHASLARSIELSLASPRLGEPGKRLFRLLGALPAGLAPEDEEPLLGANAAEAVRQLRAVGLAREVDGRLDLLPPVRRYAASKHAPRPDEQRVWIARYLELAGSLGGSVGRNVGGARAAARLLPEAANLEAAFAGAPPAGLLRLAVSAIPLYAQFASALGVHSAGLHALAAACQARGEHGASARCFECLGGIALHRGEYDVGRKYLDAAELAYRKSGNRAGEATCIHRKGAIAFEMQEFEKARQAFTLALDLFVKEADKQEEANSIKGLADVAAAENKLSEASNNFVKAKILYELLGEPLGQANCATRLAEIALVLRDYPTAQDGFNAALPIFREIGDVVGEAQCFVRLGELAAKRGRNDEARRLIDKAIALFQRVNSSSGVAWATKARAQLGL